MGSRVVLDAAVRKIKSWSRIANLTAAIISTKPRVLIMLFRRCKKSLTISGVRTTQLVAVSMEAKSPQKAADIANGVARAFIDYSLQQKQKHLASGAGAGTKKNDGRPENQNGSAEGGHR